MKSRQRNIRARSYARQFKEREKAKKEKEAMHWMKKVNDCEQIMRTAKGWTPELEDACRDLTYAEYRLEIGDEELERRYGEMVKQINNSDKIQEKQRMAAAALLLADDIADKVIFKDDLGRLTFDELKPYLLTAEEIAPGARAYEFLIDWIMANGNRFGEDAPNDFYGLIEDGWAYVVRSEFDKVMSQEGFSSRAVLNDWYLKGLIQTEERGGKTRYTKRRRIKDKRANFVVVSMPEDEDD